MCPQPGNFQTTLCPPPGIIVDAWRTLQTHTLRKSRGKRHSAGLVEHRHLSGNATCTKGPRPVQQATEAPFVELAPVRLVPEHRYQRVRQAVYETYSIASDAGNEVVGLTKCPVIAPIDQPRHKMTELSADVSIMHCMDRPPPQLQAENVFVVSCA